MSGGLRYERKFGESASLTVDGNLTGFDNRTHDAMETNGLTEFRSSARSAVNKANARADFTQPFRKGMELSAGITIDSYRSNIDNDYYRYGAFRNKSVRPDYRSFNRYFSKRFGSDKVKSAKKIEAGDDRLMGY